MSKINRNRKYKKKNISDKKPRDTFWFPNIHQIRVISNGRIDWDALDKLDAINWRTKSISTGGCRGTMLARHWFERDPKRRKYWCNCGNESIWDFTRKSKSRKYLLKTGWFQGEVLHLYERITHRWPNIKRNGYFSSQNDPDLSELKQTVLKILIIRRNGNPAPLFDKKLKRGLQKLKREGYHLEKTERQEMPWISLPHKIRIAEAKNYFRNRWVKK